jgi:hypothetical protein
MAIPMNLGSSKSPFTKKQKQILDFLFDRQSMRSIGKCELIKKELEDHGFVSSMYDDIAQYYESFGYNVWYGLAPQGTGKFRWDYAQWVMIISENKIERPR